MYKKWLRDENNLKKQKKAFIEWKRFKTLTYKQDN